MLIVLVFNYSIRFDGYAIMDVIAHLWPCYGLIAMNFVFFAAGLLLFISTGCNHFTGDDDDGPSYISNDETAHMSCSVATGILLNTAYYLGLSILGFMILLREIKNEGIFDLGYIIIAVSSCMTAVFMLSQLSSLVDWYHSKILLPLYKNELALFCANITPFEIDLMKQTVFNNPENMRERQPINNASYS